MKVVLIHEDNHGLIGVAKDYKSAIHYLLNEDWINAETEIFQIDETLLTLGEMDISFEDILEMEIETFNNLFEGMFFLDIDNVYEV